jgi:putative NIF3 family GTP cyclohydrolase 1 type 2
MGIVMIPLATLVQRLDALFGLDELEQDPSFGRLLPTVYASAGIDWQSMFEPAFVNRFNGLMLRGAEEVHTVFCAALPTPQVLAAFVGSARPGDLFFTHHPIDLEMGDPRGRAGRGLLPIEHDLLDTMLDRRLSFYACHAPMDYNREVGTTLAMEQVLGATFQMPFYPFGNGHAGSICTIEPTSTAALIETVKDLFGVPYVDFVGVTHDRITRLAVVAGAADSVATIREAEALRAQALLSGEVRSHRGDAYGRAKFERVMAYLPHTTLSLIGVSHAASEQLVMDRLMIPWLRDRCRVETVSIRMDRWWR